MRDLMGSTAISNGCNRLSVAEILRLQMVLAGATNTGQNMPRGYRRRTVVQCEQRQTIDLLEREMGFEPTTSSLGSWHSTTELLPLSAHHFSTNSPNRHQPCRTI